MTDNTPRVRKLHAQYCSCTGQFVPLTMGRIMAWENWMSHGMAVGGWDESDIEAVVALLKRMIREGKKWPQSLWFRNLIENMDNFEEYHAAARAWKRQPRIDQGKASVLRATHRPAQAPQNDAKPVGDVIAGAKAFAEFRALRDSLIVLALASLLTGCRVPGVDQHENNHKIIQTWDSITH